VYLTTSFVNVCLFGRYDTRLNDIHHNDVHHNSKLITTPHHNDTDHYGRAIILLSVLYANCRLCWVLQISPICWVSLCWVECRYAEWSYAERRGAFIWRYISQQRAIKTIEKNHNKSPLESLSKYQIKRSDNTWSRREKTVWTESVQTTIHLLRQQVAFQNKSNRSTDQFSSTIQSVFKNERGGKTPDPFL
jgi:hypothetical protein